MMEKLKDHIALVTGGSSGIGKAIAKKFLEEGAKVILFGRDAKKGAEAVAEMAQEYGENAAEFYTVDVSNSQETADAVSQVLAHFGKVDILVNNASAFTVYGNYNYNAYVDFGVHYRIRRANLEITEDDPPPSLRKQTHENGLISAIGWSAIYDSTNSAVRPSYGFKSRLETEFAGLGGNFMFFSVGYLNTYYWQLSERDVMKFRADARFIQPLYETSWSDLPLDERIFLGGENEIRGYRPYRLGPKFNHDSDDPEGGISMQLISMEYQRRIWSRLDAFAFFDAGHLSEAHWAFGHMNCSTGVGVRLQVMENGPPFTIGYGFPIHHRNRSDIKKFFFNIGGRF